MTIRRIAILVALCSRAIHAQAIRDSAGLKIIENLRPTWSARERLTLTAAPLLAFGDTINPNTRFRQVRGVMRMDDGRIAVADGRSRELRFFASDGRWLNTVGHVDKTSGRPLSVDVVRRLRGDSIAVTSGLTGATAYSRMGEFGRWTAFGDPGDRSPRHLMLDVMPDGKRLATLTPNVQPRPAGTRWVDSLSLRILAPDRDSAIELGRFGYVEFVQESKSPSSPWLSPIGVFATGLDRVYVGYGDRYEIRVFNGSGAPQTIIRRAWKPIVITDDDWEQWVVEWSKLWVSETGAARDSAVDAVRRSPWAETLPAFVAFQVDRTGRLWARQAHWQDAIAAGSYTDRPAVPSEWSVFDTRGRWLGDVTMPKDFQVFEIGADYVAGIEVRDRIARVTIYGLSSR